MSEAGRITAAIDGDVTGLANALNQARSQATAAVSGIESDFKSKLGGGMSSLASDISKSMQGGFGGIREGLTKSLTSGDFSSAGAGIGNQVVSGLSSSLGPIGGVAGEVATTLGPSGIIALGAIAGGAVIAGAIVSGVASAVAAAGQFETAMSGAKKVISLDEGADAGAYFSELGSDLQELSTQAPVAATDLAALAAVGGSLGVASTEIAGFAESAAQMSVAFELPAEQAATAAAKILNAFQQPINTENMQSLGNVINEIGDSMAATEADVLDFTNRASFLNTTMGLSVTQVATLGGVLISAGLTAETAAGGIKSAMNQLTSTSSKTGGMDNWAALMGVSVDELKDKVAGDLPNTLIETANKIAAIEDPVERFQTAVNLAGSEGAPALLKLAGAQDTYNSALAQTISQWDKGQSGEAGGMAKTFEQNASTYEAAGTMLNNAFTYASVALGNVFLPAATSAVSGLTSLVVGAVDAGQAIGSIVSNSQAASAIGSTFSSIGSIATAVFGNLSAVVTPVWDAIGGGSGVMAGLQAAFDAATGPITLVFTGISTLTGGMANLVSAAQPVYSAIGSGLASAITTASSAIKTGSAYVQAFKEALSNMVSGSDAVQSLVGLFDSVSSSISGVVDWVSDLGSAIVSGLTTAIPQAASGFSSAIGSLMGQAGNAASGYFEDAIKDSPLGGIFGFVDSVSSRASEIMATGEASAASVAEGIENSDELNEALSKAADFDSPENIEAAKKAGINVGGAAGEESAKGYWDEFEKEFKQQQTERDISKLLARGTTASKGNVAGTTTTKLDSGLEVEVAYQGNNKSIMSRLFIDGQQIGDAVYGANLEESTRKLLEGSGFGYNEGNVLDVTGKVGEAAVWRLSQSAKIEYDYTGISETLQYELEGSGRLIGENASEEAVDAFQSMLDAAREPTIENIGSFIEAVTDNVELGNLLTGDAADDIRLYKEEIASQVVDADQFVKDQLESIGDTATAALSDGIINSTETDELLGLKPQIEFLQEYFPEQFAAIGGDAALELIAALEAGNYDSAKAIIEEKLSLSGAVDQYIDYAENIKTELSGIGEEIGDAFTEGLLLDTDRIQESIDNLKNLQIYDPEAAKAQGTDNAIIYLTSLKEAIENYEDLKAKLLFDPDNDNLRELVEKAKQIVEDYSENSPAVLKVTADTSIFGTSMTDIAGSIDLADIIANPSTIDTIVGSGEDALQDFIDNTFQPQIADQIDFYLGQWDSGYGEAREMASDYVDAMVKASEDVETRGLFSNKQLKILEKYKKGLIDTGTALKGISDEANKTASAVETLTNFAENASKGSYEDKMFYKNFIGSTEDWYHWLAAGYSGKSDEVVRKLLVDADCDEANKALQELEDRIAGKKTVSFGVDTSNVYLEFEKIEGWTGEAKKISFATDIGSVDSAIEKVDSWTGDIKTVQVTADTSMAAAVIDEITASDTKYVNISFAGKDEDEDTTKEISVETTEAKANIDKLDEDATAEKSKLVKINDTLALKSIAAIDLAASRGVTKTVTIAYDDSGYESSTSSSSSSTKKTAQQLLSQYYFSPLLSFANEGYVASPTLAVVGDRPGGEYVVGAARFEAAAAKAQGRNVVINITQNINGSGLSKDELTSVLEKNNKSVIREVADQIKTGKSF